MFTKGRYCRI